MTTKQQPSQLIPTEVERVRRRFERWRRTRKQRSRIPAELWHAAVQVAGSYGINKTARALGLDYYDLRKRLAAGVSATPVEKEAMESFVELVTATPGVTPECVVELDNAGGTKMRIRLNGTPDVAWLRSLLFGGES
jgi:hypothetical protein